MVAKPCSWGSIGRFVSSYISAHAQTCVCAPLHIHTHTCVCDSPTGSETPLPRQVPILSNSSQHGPTDKALAWGYTQKTLALKISGLQREDWKKLGRDLRFMTECGEGVLAVWDITVLACAGRMELLSIIFIYTHLRTHKGWSAGGEHTSHVAKWDCSPEKKGSTGWLFRQTNTMFMFSAKSRNCFDLFYSTWQ